MTRVLMLAMLVGCIDVLDGDIEEPETCCVYWPSKDRAGACLARFLEPGTCSHLDCDGLDWSTGSVCVPDER